ncbi:MAG: glycosyltransferase family 2 protein [Verrucomicrobia bacterium]|nr:glycosyltransferase family 2 protein [Verrucomicrobiota bacterium]
MKFSVLLPTRNRLQFLKYAISSVMRQDYGDWEIIVSDNHSEENIGEYVAELNDQRIRYFRTDRFVSVTENWNNALNHCSGDYIIMLGDDDALLDGYFTSIDRLISEYDSPDMIYSNAYIYAYPRVVPNAPDGFLHSCKDFCLFEKSKKPLWLSKKMGRHLVEGHLNFTSHYGTNMQYATIKRSQIEKLKFDGQLFHGPYPDVYVMNALMLEAERILVNPEELVVIGMSPKSTGNYLVNNDEANGMEFLNISKELASIDELTTTILPGSHSLTAWLVTMEMLKDRYKDKYPLVVNRAHYRKMQIKQSVRNFLTRSASVKAHDLLKLFKILNWRERAFFLSAFLPAPRTCARKAIHTLNKLRNALLYFGRRLWGMQKRCLKKLLGIRKNPVMQGEMSYCAQGMQAVKFSNILDVFDHIKSQRHL